MMPENLTVQKVIALLPAVSVGLVKSGWDREVVADAAQELMLRILENKAIRAKLDALPAPKMRPYLLAAVRNQTRDLLRRQRQTLAAALDLNQMPDLDAQQEVDTWIAVTQAIRRVPRPYREVLELLILERQGAKRIAKTLHRKLPTIYQQIHRGEQKLRTLWPPR
jgi:RNA polymerase sigma factor (sigma-70 family)